MRRRRGDCGWTAIHRARRSFTPLVQTVTVDPAALSRLTAATRAAAHALDPGSCAAACAQAVTALGGLSSAGALAALALDLTSALDAVQRRWTELVEHTGAAALRYARLEAAVVRAEGSSAPVVQSAGVGNANAQFGSER